MKKRYSDASLPRVRAIVPRNSPFAFFYEVDEDLAVELARFHNDQLSQMAKEHPDRFAAIATLPMQVPAEASKELVRAVRTLGLRGVEIGSNVNKRELGDEIFWPIYKVLEELDVPMFVHPHRVAGVDRLLDFYLKNLIGNPLDTTIAATRLILSGTLEKFPRMKVILAHGGGQLPFIFGRIEHGFKVRPEPREKVRHPPRAFLKNLYFDTITHNPDALRYLIGFAGSDHVLMGSDYPHDMGDPDPVEMVTGLQGISEEDRRRILHENAVALFGLHTLPP